MMQKMQGDVMLITMCKLLIEVHLLQNDLDVEKISLRARLLTSFANVK